MSAITLPPNFQDRIHLLDSPEVIVQDLTTEKKISVCVDRDHILWNLLGFYWASPDGKFSLMAFGSAHFTENVLVTDGDKPGRIWIHEQERPREVGAVPRQWIAEINTKLIAYRRFSEPNPMDESKPVTSYETCYIARNLGEITLPDPATVSIVASFPINESGLSDEHLTLLNKMVNGAVPVTAEHQTLLSTSGRYKQVYDLKMKRIHHFQEGVPLFDCTKESIAGIIYNPEPVCNEEITLRGIPLLYGFQRDAEIVGLPFSRMGPGFTNYVVVLDGDDESVIVERIECLRPGKQDRIKEICLVDLKDSNLKTRSDHDHRLAYRGLPLDDFLKD